MIYSLNGTELSEAFDIAGSGLDYAYDISGNVVFQSVIPWDEEITVEKKYNSTASTYYYVIRIPQTRSDGSKQYPFVFAPNGSNGGTMSTLTMMQTYGFYMGINAGVFDLSETRTKKPYGILVQNGVSIECINNSWFDETSFTLTIDGNGELGYKGTVESGVTAQAVINDGAVSAVSGFIPLVSDGVAITVSDYLERTDVAQRQIIGQFANGDYCVITAEGRNYDSSTGFTASQIQQVCVSEGLDFAFMLDGGGSVETVIGDTQLNKIYDGTYGRVVPTYIVFNGTDRFFVPSEVTVS